MPTLAPLVSQALQMSGKETEDGEDETAAYFANADEDEFDDLDEED